MFWRKEKLQAAAVFPQSGARNEQGASEEVEAFQTSSPTPLGERTWEAV